MSQKKTKKIKILISSVVVCILTFLLMIVYIPKFMGYKSFYIESGSMSPSITQGSMVLEKKVEFEDIAEGDILTFKNDTGTEYFTHRVVSIDTANKMLVTKGDANEDVDPGETNYYFVEGRVDFSVPLVGYLMSFLNSTTGKIVVAAIYIAWIAIEIEIIVMKRKAPQDDQED